MRKALLVANPLAMFEKEEERVLKRGATESSGTVEGDKSIKRQRLEF
jgi:hypothetical protein